MEGLWTIFGPILTIVIALVSKNVVIALFFGICYLSIGINGLNFLGPIVDYFIAGVNSNGMILVLFVPFGVMIHFMRIGGGFKAFSNWANKRVNNRKQAGFMVFLLSSVLASGNDIISNVATGRILKPIVRENRLSPYKSALISSSVGPNLATPFPYSTYFLFCIGMIGMLIPQVNAVGFFYKSIGLSIHTWLTIILALLVALEIIPDIGIMKKHQDDAAKAEQTEDDYEVSSEAIGGDIKPDFGAFIVPLAVMILSMLITSIIAGEVVMVPGAFVAAITAVLYTMIRRSVKSSDVGNQITAGILEQGPIILLLAFAFAFGALLQQVGFSEFIVYALSGTLPHIVVPVICLLISMVIGYTTGSLGSALVIMLPLAIPLAGAVGANLPLTFAAVYSGSQWGDQTSPISDVLIENSGANEVDPVNTSKAIMPYRLIEGGICLVFFAIMGFII